MSEAIQAEECDEASALLLMLINKIHATKTRTGARLRIDLSVTEMDRLCAWGDANKDLDERQRVAAE